MKNVKFDLEERLIDFACLCLDVCDLLPHTRAGQNLEYQLSKSSTAAALNYGEAQAAESRVDFLHKMKVVLKEIRESGVNLKIIKKKQLVMDPIIDIAVKEADELRAIFIKSIDTAKKKRAKTPAPITDPNKNNFLIPYSSFLISYFLFLISHDRTSPAIHLAIPVFQ